MFTTSPIGSKHRVTSQPFSRPVELPSQYINLQPGHQPPRESKVDPEKQRQTLFGLTERYRPIEMDSEISSPNGVDEEESEDVMFSAEESARLNDEFHQLSFQQMDDTMAEDDSVTIQRVIPQTKSANKPFKHVTFREQDSSIVDNGSSYMSDSSFAEGLRISSTNWAKKSASNLAQSISIKKSMVWMLVFLVPVIAYGLSVTSFHMPSVTKIWGNANYSQERDIKIHQEELLRNFFEESERTLRKEAEDRIRILSIELSQKTQQLNYDIASLAELLEQQKALRKEVEEEVAHLRRQDQSYKDIADHHTTETQANEASIEVDVGSSIINYASSSTVDKSLSSQCFLGSDNSAWGKLRRWLFVRYVDCTPCEQAVDDSPVDTGKFWSFGGNHGFLTLDLPLVLSLDSFALSVPSYMRLESPDIAPKEISIWVSVNTKMMEQLEMVHEQPQKRSPRIPKDFVKILDFTYDLSNPSVTQTGYFPEDVMNIPAKKIMIEFTENFGSEDLTAVCKLEVLGQPFGHNKVEPNMLEKSNDDELYENEDLLGHDEAI